MKRIILGSSSPRRKEILDYFTLPYLQVSPSFDESSVPLDSNPREYVSLLAQEKAKSLELQYPDEIILTADTIVWHNSRIYNKPKDREEAFSMLSTLSGRWHSVFTGVCVTLKNRSYVQCEETRVLLNPLTDEDIENYLKANCFQDKAGAYAVQKSGSILIHKIDGCFYNTMGLPITTLQKLLMNVDINLWHYLGPCS